LAIVKYEGKQLAIIILSVVLGSYNRLRFLKLTIDSIRRELDLCPFSHEIIVVDGGSTDGTLKWLAGQKDIITIIQHNRGEWRGRPVERRSWGYFMNLGFRCAQGKYVCMLSDDCLVVPGAIRNGVNLFEERLSAGENISAIAFYWRNWPEQENYMVGLTLGNRMLVNHGLYLKDALEAVAYIDEETYHFYHADGDLCLKMWHNGYSCIDSPDSYVEHYSHANFDVRGSNQEKQQKDFSAYLKKWEGIFYYPEANNIGGWITKEFMDTTLTAANFKHADAFNWYIKRMALKLMGLLKKK
jgi:glycosyltransferase involved in cell wall biosynthesis